jgi:hypothetical protein
MHDPWRMVLLTTPDGSTVPARVWLPPVSGLDGAQGDPVRDRGVELPVQRAPGPGPDVEV